MMKLPKQQSLIAEDPCFWNGLQHKFQKRAPAHVGLHFRLVFGISMRESTDHGQQQRSHRGE